MVFGLFKKHCALCGKEVSKDEAIERFGVQLCSSEHAEEYRKETAREKAKSGSKGGCCG